VKKDEFLKSLRDSLSSFSSEEREEIIRDQEEYIRDAVTAGRNEEAVITSLGDPKAFASKLQVQTKLDRVNAPSSGMPEQVRNVFGAVLAILALAPFNVIFVLGPFMALVGITIAGWAMSFSGILIAATLLGAFAFKLVFFGVGLYTHLSAFFLCMGVVGLGLLGLVLMFWITKFFIQGTVSYLRWNLKMIQGKAL
jgi:uncharacterized membrane protein